MRQIATYLILTIFTIIFVNCQQSNNRIIDGQIIEPKGELIAIDFQDSIYDSLLPLYAKDTVTKDGWSIKYFVKNNSTRYDDIYIQCSKGNLIGIFHGENLLQYRLYFIPEFVRETNSYIYFTHGCATDCWAILAFSKDNTSKYTDYERVVDYNLDFEQILYVTDRSYKNEEDIYDLALVDLKNNKTHSITYNNLCRSVYKPSCIDTVIFGQKQVIIKTSLLNIKKEEDTIETKIIKL